MPEHLQEYWQTHQSFFGLFWRRPDTKIGKLAEELVFIWESSEAEEWVNINDWIPF